MMPFALKMLALCSLSILAGCSFHSSQWEGIKAVWDMRSSKARAESEAYWWEIEHGGEFSRLFPIAWKDRIVLTDSRRWMVVLLQNDILLIRDFLLNEQVSFSASVGAQEGNIDVLRSDVVGSGWFLNLEIVTRSLRFLLLRVRL